MRFYCRNAANKGLGDWIEGRTHTFKLDRVAHWFATRILGRTGCLCPSRRNQLNVLYPCDAPKLTIGIPHYNDFEGLWATVTSLVVQAREAGLLGKIEILVVDQSPDPIQLPEGQPQPPSVQAGELAKAFIEGWVNGTKDDSGQELTARYLRYNHALGTTIAKDIVFRASATEWTLCLDSHVTLEADSLKNVYRWICSNRTNPDLYHGVLIYDGYKGVATHLDPQWRGQMWGVWATDDRGLKPSMKPFEIPAAAGWAFMCRTDRWIGYHPLMRGFGGEETFLQKLWQKNGRTVFCHPALRGIHRFGRTGEMAPVTIEDKIRNYTLGLTMLGEDLEEMRNHFTESLTPEHVDLVIAGAISEHMNVIGGTGPGQQSKPTAPQGPRALSLEELYEQRVSLTSDINEHLPTLRRYAAECRHVTEFGTRSGVSTVALLAAQPEVLHTWDKVEHCPCKSLKSLAGKTDFHIKLGDVIDITPIEETDLLFIDTYHNAEQMRQELSLHAGQVRKYIVMHDTTTFWENGESYDGTPREGLKYAVEPFLAAHPEWSVKERYENNNGLLILERADPISDSQSGIASVPLDSSRSRARLRRKRQIG